MKKHTWPKIVFGIWVALWAYFLIRPFYKKDIGTQYAKLLSLSTEEKKSFLVGPELYQFIRFCNVHLPPNSSVQIVGLGKESIDHRRATYYLYPHIMQDDPEFLLVYKADEMLPLRYTLLKALDDERYILKRRAR